MSCCGVPGLTNSWAPAQSGIQSEEVGRQYRLKAPVRSPGVPCAPPWTWLITDRIVSMPTLPGHAGYEYLAAAVLLAAMGALFAAI